MYTALLIRQYRFGESLSVIYFLPICVIMLLWNIVGSNSTLLCLPKWSHGSCSPVVEEIC